MQRSYINDFYADQEKITIYEVPHGTNPFEEHNDSILNQVDESIEQMDLVEEMSEESISF